MTFQLNDNISFQFSVESRKHLAMHGSFTFKIEKVDNGSFVASIEQDKLAHARDDVGALYYVVAVILIYGCSILMMIASYIRKNDNDRRLSRYLKEMASVRKRETQLQLLTATAKAANLSTRRSLKDKKPQSLQQSPRLSSVSEVSRDYGTSDLEKDWDSKGHQYHLLTPTPSPGITPGNSPSSISNSPVFTEFPKKEKHHKKKNPHVVRWVCETETETDSEFEHKLLTCNNSPNMYQRDKKNGWKNAEGPSVIITPSNSPKQSRAASPSVLPPMCLEDNASVSSREEPEIFEPEERYELFVNHKDNKYIQHQEHHTIDRLEVRSLLQNENVRVSTV